MSAASMSRAFFPLALTVVLSGVLFACSNGDRPSGVEGTSQPAPTSQTAPTCQRNEPGCPCSNEGKRIACGKVTSKDPTGKVTCGLGGQVCSSGRWSECQIDSFAPGHDGVPSGGLGTQTLGSAVACDDKCDLYCKSVLDTPDDTVPLGDAGVILTDGGITLPGANRTPDGGPTPEDLLILADSGGIPDSGPDGPALIFHELLPGETAEDPVILPKGEVPSTDIYFLLDDTASMYDESAALTSAIQDPSGQNLLKRIRALFNDNQEKVQFGFGRFEEYKASPYVKDTSTNLAFQHILSITGDQVAAGVAAKWVREDSYGAAGASVLHSGGTFAESTVSALMMLATGGLSGNVYQGLWKSGAANNCNPSNWWMTPRTCWPGSPIPSAYFTLESATAPAADYPAPPSITVPCPSVANPPAGYNPGYPCWRPNKTPIVIVMTDAPSHNGPGGHYSYVQTGTYGLTGAQPFGNAAAAPTAVGLDGSAFSKAVPLTLPALGSGAVYYGTVPSRASGSSVGGGIVRSETDRQLVATFPAAGTMTVGTPYRSTLRDCSVAQNYTTCVPGTPSCTTLAPQTQNAEITQAPTVTTVSATVQLPTVTDVGASTTPLTCSLSNPNASCSNMSYPGAPTSSGVLGVAGQSLPAVLNQIGSVIVPTAGQRLRVYLDLMADGQIQVQARAFIRVSSAPTGSSGNTSNTNSITNSTTSVNKDVYATANNQTFFVAVERQLGNASFPQIRVRYEITTPNPCSAAQIKQDGNNTNPPKCCTCGGAYTKVAVCSAGTALAGQAGCQGSGPTTCSTGSLCVSNTRCCTTSCPANPPGKTWTLSSGECGLCPVGYAFNAATNQCTQTTCPVGWSYSGGLCRYRSCSGAGACPAGYTCSGADGSATCTRNRICSDCAAGTACTAGPSVSPAVAAGHVSCCPAANPCNTTTTVSKGDGFRYGDMIYKFTVPKKDASLPDDHPTNRYFYHFALLRSATGTALTSDSGAILYIKPASAAFGADQALDANADGKVLDCNRDANKFNVIGFTAEADRYVRSEVNSYLAPGDYYLVVDKLGDYSPASSDTPAYNYVLQVGAFDDAVPYAAPSYKQMTSALNALGVKTIGIDSSGVSCQQAGSADTNVAQYDTRDFLEQLGRDTGSVDGVTGKPFVVPIRKNANDCAGGAGTNGLQDAVEKAVSDLTKTLREDLVLRAVYANQPVTSPVFVPPSAPAAFIKKVEALPSQMVTDNCGSASPVVSAIANDSITDYQKFQVCLPGTEVVFKVTFQMPVTIPRTNYDQFFRFDVVILRGLGEVARVPVVLKLPRLPVPGDFYRDYDMTNACPIGARIVWDRFAWDTDTPLTDPTNTTRIGSKIDISVVMGTSQAELVALTGTAAEKPLATAKASPLPNTEVGSALLGPVIDNRRDHFLRVHFRLSPSDQGAYPNNAIYVPTLRSWQLFVSCPPSE